MFNIIREKIANYKNIPKSVANRPMKWFDVFATIRKAYYAHEITIEQYNVLMDELGIE